MAIYAFSILQLIFLNIAFAADLSCSSLFEVKLSIENRAYTHMLNVEQKINGIARENPYIVINNDLQFRYFDINDKQELKLIGRHEIGIADKKEVQYLQETFSPQLIETQEIGDNKYMVDRWVVIQNISKDFNSGLVKADDVVVREALDQVIRGISLTHNPQEKAILFLDVDNLGIVNYFPGGHTTGDAYIKAITEVVTENLRSEDGTRFTNKDIGFKNYNGDEFFYLLDNINKNEIPLIFKRLENALNKDPRITVFKIKALSQYESFKNLIKSLRNYSELETLPSLLSFVHSRNAWRNLSQTEVNEIESSPKIFKKFISAFLQSNEIGMIKNNINNIALGGTFGIEIIKSSDTLDSVLFRASQAMEKYKILKKSNQNKIRKESIYFPEL